MTTVYYKLTRGANFSKDMQLKDKFGAPINLTGLSAVPFEVAPTALQATFTVSVIDATAGMLRVTCPWSSNWPAGLGVQVQFRFQLSNGKAYGPIGIFLK